ncbi:MAG: cytochrome c oxidase subunit 3 [Candidatus Coatesbacteria bacterium]
MTEEGGHGNARASRMGMWLFLFTEMLLFGGLFLVYAVYRRGHPEAFHAASGELSLAFGAGNTILLLTSSLSMALAVAAFERGLISRALALIGGTIGMGLLFLVNKGLEWSVKFGHGLYPGAAVLEARDPGERLFFSLYFAMTGLHGLHVLVGAGVLGAVVVLVRRSGATAERHGPLVENAGLYWHLVDIVWIFLFPLFYLIT